MTLFGTQSARQCDPKSLLGFELRSVRRLAGLLSAGITLSLDLHSGRMQDNLSGCWAWYQTLGLKMLRSHTNFSQAWHLFSLEVVSQINDKHTLPPEGENMFTRVKCFLMPVHLWSSFFFFSPHKWGESSEEDLNARLLWVAFYCEESCCKRESSLST